MSISDVLGKDANLSLLPLQGCPLLTGRKIWTPLLFIKIQAWLSFEMDLFWTTDLYFDL